MCEQRASVPPTQARAYHVAVDVSGDLPIACSHAVRSKAQAHSWLFAATEHRQVGFMLGRGVWHHMCQRPSPMHVTICHKPTTLSTHSLLKNVMLLQRTRHLLRATHSRATLQRPLLATVLPASRSLVRSVAASSSPAKVRKCAPTTTCLPTMPEVMQCVKPTLHDVSDCMKTSRTQQYFVLLIPCVQTMVATDKFVTTQNGTPPPLSDRPLYLFNWACPYVHRVTLALSHKKVCTCMTLCCCSM